MQIVNLVKIDSILILDEVNFERINLIIVLHSSMTIKIVNLNSFVRKKKTFKKIKSLFKIIFGFS